MTSSSLNPEFRKMRPRESTKHRTPPGGRCRSDVTRHLTPNFIGRTPIVIYPVFVLSATTGRHLKPISPAAYASIRHENMSKVSRAGFMVRTLSLHPMCTAQPPVAHIWIIRTT